MLLDPVGIGEPEVLVQAAAHVVAVEQVGAVPKLVEPELDQD